MKQTKKQREYLISWYPQNETNSNEKETSGRERCEDIRAGMSLQKFNDNQIAWGGDVHKLSYNLAERVVKSFDGRAEKG